MKYKKALIIGRFQPFHFGHLYLIKKTLEISEKIIIGIGSASIFDENNPLDYKTRENIIKKVFVKEGFENRLEKIVPLEDFFDDEKWLKNVVEKAGGFDIVVSNNEWTNSIMEKNGYKVIRFPYYKRYLYEGWRIRKLAKQKKYWLNRIPIYLKIFFTNRQPLITNHFDYIVIGGTFDHFHKGHKALIKSALKYGKKIIIGITSNNFIKNKFLSEIIEDFKVRKNNVSDFLKKQKASHRALIIKINNFIGDLDKRKKVDAIIVSKNTYYNALRINEIREKNNLNKLRIIIQKDVLSDDGAILSSERIRRGEIDRSGKSYWLLVNCYLEKGKEELILPENLKKELRKPLGKIFKSTDEVLRFIKLLKPVMTIAVGDIIYTSLAQIGFISDVGIVDNKSRRISIDEISNIKYQISNINKKEIKNKQGTINRQAFNEILSSIKDYLNKKNKKLIIVNGEEDLLTLPAILFAPLGSLVLYGHWQYGVIGVVIDEKIKNKITKIIYQFNLFDKPITNLGGSLVL